MVKSLENKLSDYYKDNSKIAYFSMEVGLENSVPTYSGGLGILAGDTLKSFADLEVPLVGVTMMYHEGYFRQKIDKHGWQKEIYEKWAPSKTMTKIKERTKVKIEGRDVHLGAWRYDVKGATGHIVPVYFLDSDLRENSHQDRELTQRLYSGDNHTRICQEVILGIGGLRLLRELGLKDQLETFHMNEGHASFLTLELLKERNWKDEDVKKSCVFTTHTPVAAGHDVFDYGLAYKVMHDDLPWHIKQIAGEYRLSTTELALNLSRKSNGVAKKHGEVSRNMFPGYDIDSITNGIHSRTWTTKSFIDLFDKYCSGWESDEKQLENIVSATDDEIVEAHKENKKELIDYVNSMSDVAMDDVTLTIGFARRAAGYKRADLLFSDLERLIEVSEDKVQFIFAGKAHPNDGIGKDLIHRVINCSKDVKDKVKVVYLENYDMDLGKLLTAGVDIWLNNPVRPREASGTSGMKSTHNGVMNFSVLDGWWIEGHEEDVTGWSIGPDPTETNLIENDGFVDSNDLYDKLETKIIPKYYDDPKSWTWMMKQTVKKNASVFNTSRMAKEYKKKVYNL